jgi:hypothetical protein
LEFLKKRADSFYFNVLTLFEKKDYPLAAFNIGFKRGGVAEPNPQKNLRSNWRAASLSNSEGKSLLKILSLTLVCVF